jgi:hypothetical protein
MLINLEYSGLFYKIFNEQLQVLAPPMSKMREIVSWVQEGGEKVLWS